MANITGTPGGDILTGTAGNDSIDALDFNDRIIGTTGNDIINGGDGYDKVDYSNLGESIVVKRELDGSILVNKSGGGIDKLIGVEQIVDLKSTEGSDVIRTENVNIFTLFPSLGDDTVKALGGDDRIIGSTGIDIIDGGAGNDTIDFTGTTLSDSLGASTNNVKSLGPISLSVDGSRVTNITIPPRGGGDRSRQIFTDLINIETIIGDPTQSNTIQELYNIGGSTQRKDIDLSKNQLITYDSSNNPRIVNFQNFDNVTVVFGSSRIVGNDRDNIIKNGDAIRGPGSSDDLIIGSKGNDTLNGGSGNNVLDYSNIGRDVKVSLDTRLENVVSFPGGPTLPQIFSDGKTDKGSFGQDKITKFQTIIGATNKANTIDVTTNIDGAIVDLNLANNSLKVSIPEIQGIRSSIITFTIVNFVNAVGTKGNDTIVGANKNSKLTGGGGNDNITGGSKNDRITGTDNKARGVGEVDTLTGGGGRDKFILGDKNGAYYVGKGKDDYATITDFNLFQDSIDLGGFKNYSFGSSGNNTIELYSGKDVNTRDLIAKIQLTGGISTASSNSRSIAGSSSNLDSIIPKLDIITGTSANATA
jgi:Ca2+-binding RTX toxin-like protein